VSGTEEVIGLFRERFVQRDDCYVLQSKEGEYRPVHKPLSDEVVLLHLRGEETIGLYPFENSTTKWVCIGIDTLEPTDTRIVQ
jgi:hypothetical protein